VDDIGLNKRREENGYDSGDGESVEKGQTARQEASEFVLFHLLLSILVNDFENYHNNN